MIPVSCSQHSTRTGVFSIPGMILRPFLLPLAHIFHILSQIGFPQRGCTEGNSLGNQYQLSQGDAAPNSMSYSEYQRYIQKMSVFSKIFGSSNKALCPHVHALEFNMMEKIDAQGLKEVVRNCPNLKRLDFSDQEFLNEDLECLKTLPLTHLTLPFGSSLTDECLANLPKSLVSLDLSSQRNLTTDCLNFLKQMPFLKELDISNMKANDSISDLSCLSQMPALEKLKLRGCSWVNPVVMKSLAKCLLLKSLDLSTNASHQLGHGYECKNIIELNLSNFYMDDHTIKNLPHLFPKLQILNLEHNPIKFADLFILQQAYLTLQKVIFTRHEMTMPDQIPNELGDRFEYAKEASFED